MFRDRLALGIEHRLPGRIGLRVVVPGRIERRHLLEPVKILDGTLPHQHEGIHDADRQQHPQRDPNQIGPEVSDHAGLRAARRQVLAAPRQGTRDREGHCQPGCCRQKVLHCQRQHLSQVRQGRLTGIALPVRIGDKADGGVKSATLLDRAEGGRIQRKPTLHALQQVDHQRSEHVDHQQCQRVLRPALATGRVDAGQPPQRPLDCLHEAGVLPEFRRRQSLEPRAQRPGQCQQDTGENQQRDPELNLHTRDRSEVFGVEQCDTQVNQ